jgi:hypothetical protein
MIGKATFPVKLPHRYLFLKYFRYITIKTVYRQKSNKIRLIPSNLAIHKQSADVTKLKTLLKLEKKIRLKKKAPFLEPFYKIMLVLLDQNLEVSEVVQCL